MKVSPVLLDELAKDTSCRAMLKNLRIRCSEMQQSEQVCQCIVLKQTVRNHCLNNKELWLLISHLFNRSGNPVQFNTVLAGKFRNYAPRVHFWHLTASGTSCLTSWTYKSRPCGHKSRVLRDMACLAAPKIHFDQTAFWTSWLSCTIQTCTPEGKPKDFSPTFWIVDRLEAPGPQKLRLTSQSKLQFFNSNWDL